MLKINFPSVLEAELSYTISPWQDENGQGWIYNSAKNRWDVYTERSQVMPLSVVPTNGAFAIGAMKFFSGAYTSIFSGDSFTLGYTVITFGTNITESFLSNEEVIDAIVEYVNVTEPESFAVTASKLSPDDLLIIAKEVGVEGNSLEFSTTLGSLGGDYQLVPMYGGATPTPTPYIVGQSVIVAHSDNTKSEWVALSLHEWLPRTAGIIRRANGDWYRQSLDLSGIPNYEFLPDQ